MPEPLRNWTLLILLVCPYAYPHQRITRELDVALATRWNFEKLGADHTAGNDSDQLPINVRLLAGRRVTLRETVDYFASAMT